MKIIELFEFPSGSAYVKLDEGPVRCIPAHIWNKKTRKIGDEIEEYILSWIKTENPIRNDNECPRRGTCAFSECPKNWKECSVPNILNSVSEWLYGDSEFNKSDVNGR